MEELNAGLEALLELTAGTGKELNAGLEALAKGVEEVKLKDPPEPLPVTVTVACATSKSTETPVGNAEVSSSAPTSSSSSGVSEAAILARLQEVESRIAGLEREKPKGKCQAGGPSPKESKDEVKAEESAPKDLALMSKEELCAKLSALSCGLPAVGPATGGTGSTTATVKTKSVASASQSGSLPTSRNANAGAAPMEVEGVDRPTTSTRIGHLELKHSLPVERLIPSGKLHDNLLDAAWLQTLPGSDMPVGEGIETVMSTGGGGGSGARMMEMGRFKS